MYHLLHDENDRIKEDKQVLEKTFSIKQETITELNFKIDNLQDQIGKLETSIKTKDNMITQY